MEEKASGKKRGRGKTKGAFDKETLQLLSQAAPDAVRVMVSAMLDPEAKRELRIDCAKEVLNRLYGKSVQQAKPDNEAENKLEVIFVGDSGEYAK